MSIIDLDPAALLPGLLPGAFRGITFHIPDIRHEAGRRLVRTQFPGLDTVSIDDLGLHRGMIDVTGLILGDDYVAQAEAFRLACETAGPGTLLHPWLGERQVVVGEPAQISFAARELRAVRIRVGFVPYDAPSGVGSTLATLLSAIDDVVSPATTLVTAVAGAASIAVALWAAATTMAATVASSISTAAASSRGADDLEEALVDPLATLATAEAGAAGRDGAAALAAAVTALPEPIASVAIGSGTSAIGSATSTTTSDAFGTREGATLLLTLAGEIAALAAVSLPEQAVRTAAVAAAVAQAARVVADIDYESSQEAMAWRTRMMDALDALDVQAVAIASDAPDAVAKLLAASATLRASISADINEAIGRLPSVILVTPPAPVSAWLIAQHFAGDDPGTVVAMLDDIVARNRLRHPAIVAGTIEVLA